MLNSAANKKWRTNLQANKQNYEVAFILPSEILT
jgi:hypothetical protein